MTDHPAGLPKQIHDYLKKFGISRWRIESPGSQLYDNIVVVPAIQEEENLKTLLKSLSALENKYLTTTLFLFVINNSVSAPYDVKEENRRTIEYLRVLISKSMRDKLAEDLDNSEIRIAVIDAAYPGNEMPDKEGGVGFARKIGMDLALTLYDYNSPPKKLIICLDADCIVDSNYLTEIVENANNKNMGAGYVEYEHRLPESEEERKAIIAYEIFLRYYVLGLKMAGSRYAFDSIGSTMFCDAEHYIKIGGMNKRKAAEDFYFLEKLAKLTPIQKISSTRIYPSPRKSWRVPFGTGQRMNRFFAGTHDEYALINPECFKILKEWLSIFNSEAILSGKDYLAKAVAIHPALESFLNEQDFAQAWNKIVADSKKEKQINRQKNIWFDGFRTMKLIHYLRDNAIPNSSMFDSLDQLLTNFGISISRDMSIPDVPKQLEYLNAMRGISNGNAAPLS